MLDHAVNLILRALELGVHRFEQGLRASVARSAGEVYAFAENGFRFDRVRAQSIQQIDQFGVYVEQEPCSLCQVYAGSKMAPPASQVKVPSPLLRETCPPAIMVAMSVSPSLL